MRRDGRTLLYRRELGEERLLTTLREEHRGNGFGIEMVDHDRFKEYNDMFGHPVGGLVYCERPSREERARMMHCDEQVNLSPEQRFDTSVPVPAGSSFDLARKLVGLADEKMYEAKRE